MRFCCGLDSTRRALLVVCGVALAGVLTGCGTPGAPQPPSLKLPRPVDDLTAVRTGDVVTLHWMSPRKTTDRLLIKGPIQVAVCRRAADGEGSDCPVVGHAQVEAGAEGRFSETLPAELASGPARPVAYFVDLQGPRGRSAGPSNGAEVLAGAAPAEVTGLTAEVRADGVALHWAAVGTPDGVSPVRLHRKLLHAADEGSTKKRADKADNGLMSAAPEPEESDFLVEATSRPFDGALDTTARFGDRYEYTVQRVERSHIHGLVGAPGSGKRASAHGDGQLELAGAFSAPVQVEVVDRFPPAVPEGLVAVYVAEGKTIDLSWQPDTEADLAGYIVYRIESGDAADGSGGADWMRISGVQPVASAAYRDGTVQAGHSYRYRVSAIDRTGHESKRSVEAQETVPAE